MLILFLSGAVAYYIVVTVVIAVAIIAAVVVAVAIVAAVVIAVAIVAAAVGAYRRRRFRRGSRGRAVPVLPSFPLRRNFYII